MVGVMNGKQKSNIISYIVQVCDNCIYNTKVTISFVSWISMIVAISDN